MNGKNEVKYVYDSGRAVLELNSSNELVSRNIYGTNLISRMTDGSTAYYMYNGSGDVTGLTDANGKSLTSYNYDAFGNITEETGEFNNPYRYAGYEYDAETGLYYCNSRYYDPQTARFTTQDTLVGEPTDPLSLNRYTYCINNPLKYYDPTGYWPQGISNIFNTAQNFVNSVLNKLQNNIVKPLGNAISNAYKSFNNNVIQAAVEFTKQNWEPIKTGLIAAGMVVGGTALIVATGGAAGSEVVAVAGTIFGGAMIGSGAEIAATIVQDYMTDGVYTYDIMCF